LFKLNERYKLKLAAWQQKYGSIVRAMERIMFYLGPNLRVLPTPWPIVLRHRWLISNEMELRKRDNTRRDFYCRFYLNFSSVHGCLWSKSQVAWTRL